MSNLYIGLVHYPIYNRRKEVGATAITNFDIHDIARCAKTFGVEGFFIITPLESQIQLAKRIIRHWVEGSGAIYNPTRKDSFSLVRISRSIEEAEREISDLWHTQVKRVATGASHHPRNLDFKHLKELLKNQNIPFLILFGTGWGLTEEIKESSDYILAPIEGKGYNHLSVRSAVAIILDRLTGDRID